MRIAFAIPGFHTDSKSVEGRAVREVVSACARQVGSAKYEPGAVVFTIDRAFSPRASKEVNARALEVLLAALCALDRIWFASGRACLPLYATPVYYARTMVWDTTPALYRRGYGDCKSLSASRVAELRQSGIWCRPVFRFQGSPSATMFHILIMFEDGTWECPSALLGMHARQEQPQYA